MLLFNIYWGDALSQHLKCFVIVYLQKTKSILDEAALSFLLLAQLSLQDRLLLCDQAQNLHR